MGPPPSRTCRGDCWRRQPSSGASRNGRACLAEQLVSTTGDGAGDGDVFQRVPGATPPRTAGASASLYRRRPRSPAPSSSLQPPSGGGDAAPTASTAQTSSWSISP